MNLLLAAVLPALAVAGAPTDLDALLAALQEPPPASTMFVEQRSSGLLDQPLVLRGQLARPDHDTLLRQVEAPWFERTTIAVGDVLVEREGQPARRFSLRRAPELEALLASFHGLLSGDRALLEQHYRVGYEPLAEGWRLALVPRSSRLARRITEVVLWGRGGEMRCMVVAQGDGQGSRMLLGEAARAGNGEAPDFDGECGGTP